jgi:hypothetical protein
VRDRVYDMLYREKFEKLFQEYMGTLRAKAVVDSACNDRVVSFP